MSFELPDYFGAPMEAIRCPDCGATSFHLGPVGVEQASSVTWIGRTPHVGRSIQYAHPDMDGSVVRLDLIGECGHDFQLVFQYHDGRTVVFLCPYDPEQERPRQLWERLHA
jgi:hypothetical protein